MLAIPHHLAASDHDALAIGDVGVLAIDKTSEFLQKELLALTELKKLHGANPSIAFSPCSAHDNCMLPQAVPLFDSTALTETQTDGPGRRGWRARQVRATAPSAAGALGSQKPPRS